MSTGGIGGRASSLDGLVARGVCPEAAAKILKDAVRERQHIVVSGRVATGKTTLLQALLDEIAPGSRTVVVDDYWKPELDPSRLDSVTTLYSGEPEVTGRAGLQSFYELSLDADAVVLYEFRGPEAWDYLEFLGQSRATMFTIHSSSRLDTVERLIKASRIGRRMPAERMVEWLNAIGCWVYMKAVPATDTVARSIVIDSIDRFTVSDNGTGEVSALHLYSA
ncbi:MAG: ATPase, T2SS/T4P/T4SS family [Candidatus Dormibacteria bacterium]